MLLVVDINVLSPASHRRRRLFFLGRWSFWLEIFTSVIAKVAVGPRSESRVGCYDVMTKHIVNNKTDARKISFKSICLLCVLNASIWLNLSFLLRENQGNPKFTKFSYRNLLHFIFIPEFQEFSFARFAFRKFRIFRKLFKEISAPFAPAPKVPVEWN